MGVTWTDVSPSAGRSLASEFSIPQERDLQVSLDDCESTARFVGVSTDTPSGLPPADGVREWGDQMSRYRSFVTSLLVVVFIVAACGGGNTSADAPGSDEGDLAEIDPDGILRIAYPMARLSLAVEPENNLIFGLTSATHQGLVTQIVGTPLVLGPDGTYEPFLAESYEVVDNRTVNLVMRAGLRFHDGSSYTAQILADTMKSYQALDTTAFATTVLHQIESIEVAGETNLTFHMAEPVAGLLPETLSGLASMVAAPSSTPTQLYGAGPFQVADFVRDDHLTLERFDDYWNAAAYPLAGVEILNIPDLEAAQNALLGDQVDLIAANPADVDALLQQGPFDKVITNNQGHYMMAVCNTAPPFDDPTFREAVDLAIDREQLNQVALGGEGEPLESLWNPGSPFAVEGLIDPDGDQDRARQLLADIDWDESTVVNIGHFPGYQTHQRMVETIQGQLAQVGIETQISVVENFDVTKYFGPEAEGGFYTVANVHPGIQAVAVPGASASATWNPCGFADVELQGSMDEIIAGDLSDDDLTQAWTEVQEYVTENHLWFPLLSQPAVYVYNTDRVQGVAPGTIGLSGATAPALFLEGVSIKGT